jgi:pheromone alpha factor receptor
MNASFDPWSQPFTIIMPDGVTPLIANMADIAMVQSNAVNTSIAQSIQIGAAVMLLVTLLLITKGEKMRSAVFLLNASSLLFVLLRGIIALCVTTGPLYDFYRYETADYIDMGNSKAVSVAGEVMSFLVTVTIQLSLVMQVRIVCCNLETWKSRIINTANIFAVFTAVAIRFALMVLNVDWNITHVGSETPAKFHTISKLASAANITLVISIAISAVIFCAKLGFAITARRSMGMTQFGPMQIIFVMGCQTMCTPRKVVSSPIAHRRLTNSQSSSQS